MAKHSIFIVSASDEFKLNYQDSVSDPDINISITKCLNNNKSLAEVYNSFIDSHIDSDFIYLMHSDVSLDILGLIKHVESVNGKYDVMGLCGCSKFSISQTPLNWFCGSRHAPDSRWGCVMHGELDGQVSFWNAHTPDITDHEVACIDGLCIILTKHAVNTGLRFDTQLGMYDCYDTDISLQAIIKYHLRLGVIVRRDLLHYSVGRSILGRGFLETELRLRKKWDFPIPPNTPIAKLANELS